MPQTNTDSVASLVAEKDKEITRLTEQLGQLQARLAAADQRAKYFEGKGAEAHLRLASTNAHLLFVDTRRLELTEKALGKTNPSIAPLQSHLDQLASSYRSHIINLAELDNQTVDDACKELQRWFARVPGSDAQAKTLTPIMDDVARFRQGKSVSTSALRGDLLKRLEDLL